MRRYGRWTAPITILLIMGPVMMTSHLGASSGEANGPLQDPGGSDEGANLRAGDMANWTLVFILAADNGESDGPSYYMAKESLEGVGSSASVNALLITDGYPNKPLEADTEFWYIKKGEGSSEPISLNGVNPGWIDEINTGEPQAYVDIERYCRERYPSKYIQFVIRSDAFFSTISPDYTSDDELSVAELREAMAQIKVNRGGDDLDVLTMASCNTAMTEWFYQVSPYVDYCIGSEDRSTGRYWQLEKWLDFLNKHPAATPEELAGHIVSDYLDPSKEKWDPSKKCTVSALDMSEFLKVSEAVNDLGLVLLKKLGTHSDEIRQARDETEAVDESKRLDLFSLANHLHKISDSDIKEAAMAVKESINDTMVAQGSYLFDDVHGITIYFPLTAADYEQFINMYTSRFQFSADAYWVDFLQAFFSGFSSSPLEVDVSISDDTILSGSQATISVSVTSSGVPQSDVQVSIKCEQGGTPSPASGTTGPAGTFTSTFISPVITEDTDLVFTILATSPDKLDGHGFSKLTVETLEILHGSMSMNTSLEPGHSTEVEVLVGSEGVAVANAVVMLDATMGTISPGSGTTDAQGILKAIYHAPMTDVDLIDILTVNVSKTGYMQWGSSITIHVIPSSVLHMTVDASVQAVEPEGVSDIKITVLDGDQRVSGVNITCVVEPVGECVPPSGMTDDYGNFFTVFHAPSVNTSRRAVINITASKAGHFRVSTTMEMVMITPTEFDFECEMTPEVITSGETAMLQVQTIYDSRPLPDVEVELVLDEGEGMVDPVIGTSDEAGRLAIIYSPPDVETQKSIELNVVLSKSGFSKVFTLMEVTVLPRPKSLETIIRPEVEELVAERTHILELQVMERGTSVPGALVTLSCSAGWFTPGDGQVAKGTTDEDGNLHIEYVAPSTDGPLVVTLTATGSKNGYVNGTTRLTLNITSHGAQGKDDDDDQSKTGDENDQKDRVSTIGFISCILVVFGLLMAMKVGNYKKAKAKKEEERKKSKGPKRMKKTDGG